MKTQFNSCYRLLPFILILHILIISSVLTSCSEGYKSDSETLLVDGLIYKQGEFKPFTGFIKDTIQGKIIEYDVVAGKKNGEFKTYFKNGKLEMAGKIKDNLNQGKWTYYHENGKIESEGNFKDDLPHGLWKWYYVDGNLREEGSYVAGKREGAWTIYDLEGKIKDYKVFDNDLVIENK